MRHTSAALIISGDKTFLEPAGQQHAALIARWKNSPSVRRYAMPSCSRVTARGQREAINRALAGGQLYFIIKEKRSKRAIGYVRADWLDGASACAGLHYAIGERRRRGKGLGTDAISALLTHLFACGVSRVEAEVYDFNTPNIALLEKLGFRMEGRKREAHYDPASRRRSDTLVFGLLRREWTTPQANGGSMKIGKFVLAAALAAAISPALAAQQPKERPHTRTGDVTIISIPEFLEGRNVWVYLPPGYKTETSARYPVLYLQDGQNLFDEAASYAGEWQVDETCERMIKAGQLRPIIVIGIENDGENRVAEYTPWRDRKDGGGKGRAYLKAVQEKLIPAINAKYRTLAGPANTYIGGSSLGELISAYAVYDRPDIWGGALAVSPTYWWDNYHFLRWMTGQPKPALSFFYQDMGTKEDNSDPGHTGFVQSLRDVKTVALKQGFTEGKDFFSVEDGGAEHSEKFWARRLPAMLRMTIGAPQKTSRK